MWKSMILLCPTCSWLVAGCLDNVNVFFMFSSASQKIKKKKKLLDNPENDGKYTFLESNALFSPIDRRQ